MLCIQKLAAGLMLIQACTLTTVLSAQAQQDRPGQAAASGLTRKLGSVKSISGSTITLKADSGPDFTAVVQDNTRILRVPPGQTDLKNATPIQLPEVQAGDRMLVQGKPGDNQDSIVALRIVVMSKSDVAQKQQQDLQDWQRRGAGGIVSAIDPAQGSITLSVTPTTNSVVKTSKNTSYLRYASNSVKFADAQKGTFEQIKVGDQLRARGSRSADGKEVEAEEVISGTFRNIAGTITATDATANTVTVKDILAKKTVLVRLSPESQMRKLPVQLAQRIAFLLKGPPGAQSASGAPTAGAPGGQGVNGPGTNAGPGGGQGRAGSPDFQQMINRLPAVTVADLQKDDAVMIVSTMGTGGSEVTAITLLSGVEPILTASPSSAAALLSGWNLSAPAGDAGPQ